MECLRNLTYYELAHATLGLRIFELSSRTQTLNHNIDKLCHFVEQHLKLTKLSQGCSKNMHVPFCQYNNIPNEEKVNSAT